jgi:hypothetical protein
MNDTACADAARVLLDERSDDELARRRAISHLESCPLCASTLDLADELTTGRNSQPSPEVLRQLAAIRVQNGFQTRILLAVLVVVQAIFSVPWAFGMNPFGAMLGHAGSEHLARDGTLGILIAVVGAVTAWRTRYAFAMLAVCATIVLMQLAGGIIDEHHRTVGFDFEAVHIVALLIAGLIAFIAFRRPRKLFS